MKIKKIITAILITMVLIEMGSINTVRAYSRDDASDYAKKHATNYNSSFPKFTSDCTNFVSQCVAAGGLKMKHIPSSKIGYSHIDDIYKTKYYWASSKWTIKTTILGVDLRKETGFVTTSTWSVVAKNTDDSWWGFYNYMRDNGARCKEFRVKSEKELNDFIFNCNKGDILQIRDSTAVNKKHSIIVTDTSYDSKNKRWNMKVAYHTNDRPPTDFRTKICDLFGRNSLWTRIDVGQILY